MLSGIHWGTFPIQGSPLEGEYPWRGSRERVGWEMLSLVHRHRQGQGWCPGLPATCSNPGATWGTEEVGGKMRGFAGRSSPESTQAGGQGCGGSGALNGVFVEALLLPRVGLLWRGAIPSGFSLPYNFPPYRAAEWISMPFSTSRSFRLSWPQKQGGILISVGPG